MTRTAEHRRKLSDSMRGKKNALGARRSPETRQRMSAARRRRYVPPASEETLRDLYWARGLGKPEIADLLGTTEKRIQTAMRFFGIPSDRRRRRVLHGSANPMWKGTEAGYKAKHLRVAKLRGTPSHCILCGRTDSATQYEWANLSGNFDDPDDYVRLCVPCHRNYDAGARPPK